MKRIDIRSLAIVPLALILVFTNGYFERFLVPDLRHGHGEFGKASAANCVRFCWLGQASTGVGSSDD
ncbi:MAG TPA: hypothetical protein VK638_35110 [Edaphobacter sp.]|nr:hypothetical protein [Edaphobacter sp.]